MFPSLSYPRFGLNTLLPYKLNGHYCGADASVPSHRLEQDLFSCDFSPQLSKLLDVLVNLSQIGPSENSGSKSLKSSHVK
jgi:hypothetical protein